VGLALTGAVRVTRRLRSLAGLATLGCFLAGVGVAAAKAVVIAVLGLGLLLILV
jgi:hypothetical protein